MLRACFPEPKLTGAALPLGPLSALSRRRRPRRPEQCTMGPVALDLMGSAAAE